MAVVDVCGVIGVELAMLSMVMRMKHGDEVAGVEGLEAAAIALFFFFWLCGTYDRYGELLLLRLTAKLTDLLCLVIDSPSKSHESRLMWKFGFSVA